MKKLFAAFLVVVSAFALVSCDSEEVIPEAYGDAFIIAKKQGDATVYGLGLYAYANTTMSTVQVEDPLGMTYDLKAYSSYLYDYYWSTDEDDYTVTLPKVGNYTFDVTFKSGEKQSVGETLTTTVLAPVVFKTCTFDTTNDRINLAWDKVDGTDYVVVVLRKTDGTAVYVSQAMTGTTTTATVTTSNWINGNTASNGTVYQVELSIFAKETSSSSFIQAKAITTAYVMWGGGDVPTN